MMLFRLALAASLAVGATAASAAGISETHTRLMLPPAKGLAPVYRPIAADKDCAVKPAQVTPPGKTALPDNAYAARCATASR
jgi:hypothetical protein